MKRLGVLFCVALILSVSTVPLLGDEVDAGKAEVVRTGMTIACAAAGLWAGAAIGIGFSAEGIDTPLSDTLTLTIPVAAAGAATGALAGAWIAELTLRHQPSFLFSFIEGAGLGFVSGALVGATTFSLNFAIAQPMLDVPEGYWGDPPIPAVGMALVAGGFWGGVFGAVAGAIVVPLVVLIMGF